MTDEPGFGVVIKLIRPGSRKPPLYFHRIVPQRHDDPCRWVQLNDVDAFHAGTAGTSRWSWEAIKEAGHCWIYREESKVPRDETTLVAANDKGFEVGDLVDVRGKVVRVVPDKVLVELYSNYSGPVERWFTNSGVTVVTKAVDADEPPAGALVEVTEFNGIRHYYQRDRSEDVTGPRWHRQGNGGSYGPVLWRTVKERGVKWQRLYREDEI